jgi:hypothetical protein
VLAHVQLVARLEGSVTTLPGESCEKAMRPGPCARVMKKSSPAILRFSPPGSFFSVISVCASFHSSVWCSKKTASEPLRWNTSCGTSVPSTAYWPPWNSALTGSA